MFCLDKKEIYICPDDIIKRTKPRRFSYVHDKTLTWTLQWYKSTERHNDTKVLIMNDVFFWKTISFYKLLFLNKNILFLVLSGSFITQLSGKIYFRVMYFWKRLICSWKGLLERSRSWKVLSWKKLSNFSILH